jgi:hypothetical protein
VSKTNDLARAAVSWNTVFGTAPVMLSSFELHVKRTLRWLRKWVFQWVKKQTALMYHNDTGADIVVDIVIED